MANQIPLILSAGRQRQIALTDNLVFGGVVVSPGVITADRPTLNLSQTWNNAFVDFTGIRLNVTNSNSGPFSLLLDLQVGGIPRFNVDVSGIAYAPAFVATNYITTPAISNLTSNGLIGTYGDNGTLRTVPDYFQFRNCV